MMQLYDVDGRLPRKYRNKMKRYEHFKNMIPNNLPPQPARFEYEKENLMSAQAVAYAELLKICQKHNAGKGMYDDIQTWAIHWNQVNPNTFTEHSHANKWNCNKIIKFLKQVFPFHGLEPESVTVELHDKRQVSVPVVDFAESMRSILDDKEVMKHIMKGLDPKTWRPKKKDEEHETDPNAIIDDKDSGWLYRQGLKLHCPDEDMVDPAKVRPFPVIIHIDASHADLFGNLKVAPIQVMPAMLDVNVQQTTAAWRQVATIPNLSAGRGKDGKKTANHCSNCRTITRSCLLRFLHSISTMNRVALLGEMKMVRKFCSSPMFTCL